MKRKIIRIDEERCNGCGACAAACHEGAIEMVNGKARLTREDYCDGLGDCLPACPTGAITFEVREAPAYDEAAVKEAKMRTEASSATRTHGADGSQTCSHGGCPSSRAKLLGDRQDRDGRAPWGGCPGSNLKSFVGADAPACNAGRAPSRLMQWPCQIKLVPVNAPYLWGANLLIAADCTAYAYGSFHEELMKGRITLIGCPKLDEGDYSEKLTAIFENNDIASVTVARMEVPCCGGIESAVVRAIRQSGKRIPWQVITISTDGKILE